MNDHELLKLAAKAAGIELGDWSSSEGGFIRYYFITRHIWNPLADDGDALRLAVRLRMDLMFYSDCKEAFDSGKSFTEDATGKYSCAATRRAIVRAAAEIGRG